MGKSVEQGGCYLCIAKYRLPLAEAEVCRDHDTCSFMELAQQVEVESASRGAKGQVYGKSSRKITWACRRKIEGADATTAHDIAMAEKATDRFVSRIMRLAYLSPDVLERLILRCEPPAVSVHEFIDATYLPWAEQMGRVFDDKTSRPRSQVTSLNCALLREALCPDRLRERISQAGFSSIVHTPHLGQLKIVLPDTE